jgi:hypothetical protein
MKWPPPITREVVNIVDEILHDFDPARVRARKRAQLARLSPLRTCEVCKTGFWITTMAEGPLRFHTCQHCLAIDNTRRAA